MTHLDLRQKVFKCRLTGHDLDIGTGGFADTNYPDPQVNSLTNQMK